MIRTDLLDHIRPQVERLASDLVDAALARLEQQLGDAFEAARSALASDLEDACSSAVTAPALGHRCETLGCVEIATVTEFWPGSDDHKRCDRHHAWAVKVAEALGFRLHAAPLPVRRNEPDLDTAAQRFSLLELD